MKIIILKFISFYQFFSKELGYFSNTCVFTPSCSEYTYEAVKKYGVFRGVYMGVYRIFRCHPRQKNHYDPII